MVRLIILGNDGVELAHGLVRQELVKQNLEICVGDHSQVLVKESVTHGTAGVRDISPCTLADAPRKRKRATAKKKDEETQQGGECLSSPVNVNLLR